MVNANDYLSVCTLEKSEQFYYFDSMKSVIERYNKAKEDNTYKLGDPSSEVKVSFAS